MNDYFKKLSFRFRQKVKLQFSNPKFQEDIVILRKKWGIPDFGLKTSEEIEQWHHGLYEQSDRYTKEEWPKHRAESNKLRSQGRYVEYENKLKELNNTDPINAFRLDIKSVIKKYNLPPRWEETVKSFFFFNNLNKLDSMIGIVIKIETDPENEQERVWLGIEEDTTIEEIRKQWPMIKLHQNRLRYKRQKIFQPIKNFDRDKKAYDLKQLGKSYDEIAGILSENYNKEYGYEDAGSFIKRHKHKVGIN